jgi:hypothetical protein
VFHLDDFNAQHANPRPGIAVWGGQSDFFLCVEVAVIWDFKLTQEIFQVIVRTRLPCGMG